MTYERPSRAKYMTRADAAIRRQNMIDMFRNGAVPSVIAHRYNVTANYVRIVLAGAGEVEVEPRKNDINPMWEMDDDERRRAITNRASRAARVALNEHFSTRLTGPAKEYVRSGENSGGTRA